MYSSTMTLNELFSAFAFNANFSKVAEQTTVIRSASKTNPATSHITGISAVVQIPKLLSMDLTL